MLIKKDKSCSEIKVIGDDVVLVERPNDSLHMKSQKMGEIVF